MVEVLADAAGDEDVQLAQTCRGILDGLVPVLAGADRRAEAPEGVPVEFGPRRSPHGPLAVPPPPRPPAWASISTTEDDGITHELVSARHPVVVDRGVWGWSLMPTDMWLSQRDVLVDGRWIRTRASIQVEGGSYPLADARELHDALAELLTKAAQETPDPEATETSGPETT